MSPPPQTKNEQISLILSDSFGLQLYLLIAKIKVYEKYVTAIVLKHEHKVLRKPSVCFLEGVLRGGGSARRVGLSMPLQLNFPKEIHL